MPHAGVFALVPLCNMATLRSFTLFPLLSSTFSLSLDSSFHLSLFFFRRLIQKTKTQAPPFASSTNRRAAPTLPVLEELRFRPDTSLPRARGGGAATLRTATKQRKAEVAVPPGLQYTMNLVVNRNMPSWAVTHSHSWPPCPDPAVGEGAAERQAIPIRKLCHAYKDEGTGNVGENGGE